MKNNIYIIAHKDYPFPKLDGYNVLIVGANKNNFKNDYLKDNMGENISDKNNSYCELTGLYWMWKNDDSDHLGLVHYRRYFVDIKKSLIFKGRHIYLNKKNKYKILSIDELEERLKGYELIVKDSRYFKFTNETLLRNNLGNELWDNMRSVIEKCDKKYIDEFELLAKKHHHINCNMFYGNKKIMDKYCQWLFDVLRKIDDMHFAKKGEYYHNREIGYIPEILFGVWLNANNIKYVCVPSINIDDPFDNDGCMDIKELIYFMYKKMLKR